MSAKKVQKKGWPVKATAPPKLSNTHWGLSSVVGLVLLVMAVLQLVSFADFRDALDASGLSAPTAWAVCVIVAELWGAVGFFKVPLSFLFRQVSYTMALLAAGFWFVYNVQLVAGNTAFNPINNSAFFGRFLQQTPGWWTVIEVSVLLFAVVYKVGLLRDNQPTLKRAR
jgi:hypothetical protein